MKKVSNVITTKTDESYKIFITTKVLNDKDIIKFIQDNNFSGEDIEYNL